MSKKVPSSLLKPNSALGTYLDDMLHQATEVELEGRVETIDGNLLPEALLLEDEAITIAVDNSVQQIFEHIAEAKTEAEEDDLPEPDREELTENLFPLQFLMFKVGANLLSMPLIKMSNVINWPDTLTRLPNEPDWVRGILQYREHYVRIVDSSGVLQIKNQNPDKPSFILILEGESWGITCDAIENVVTLEYDDIQWHQNIDNKMTLGTIRDSLASLLSPRRIIKNLEYGFEN